MDFSFEAVSGHGYVAQFDGELNSTVIAEFWAYVQSVRPDGGFSFAVLDIDETEIANLAAWPGSPDTLELLHPIARMVTQSLDPAFRLAIVSTNAIIDTVIEDLMGLVQYGTPSDPGSTMAVRRFDSTDGALGWCRGEID
ncbi:MAG: hypothetical protein AAF081_04865 [Actinomycetota bacterium]